MGHAPISEMVILPRDVERGIGHSYLKCPPLEEWRQPQLSQEGTLFALRKIKAQLPNKLLFYYILNFVSRCFLI